MNQEPKTCRNENCNEIVVGRSDRQFCSIYCKSDYHFVKRKKNEKSYFKIDVDKVLRKNRAILSKYNIKSKTTIRKEVLLGEGFNPRVFTHYWKTSKGETYLFCYDQGFKEIKDNYQDKYLLVLWQPSMERQVFKQNT